MVKKILELILKENEEQLSMKQYFVCMLISLAVIGLLIYFSR